MIFNVAMYIAPGQKILRVIKEKNYKLIPIRRIGNQIFDFRICI